MLLFFLFLLEELVLRRKNSTQIELLRQILADERLKSLNLQLVDDQREIDALDILVEDDRVHHFVIFFGNTLMDTLDDGGEFDVQRFHLLFVDAEDAIIIKKEELRHIIRLKLPG